MTDSATEHLPPLRRTREEAARKITECIHDLEQLRDAIPTRTPQDLDDEFEIQRHYAIELLQSLFAQPAPALQFDLETKRQVVYTNASNEQRRQHLDSEIRQAIKQLRGLTIRLNFYQEAPPENDRDRVPVPPTSPTNESTAIRTFVVLLATLVLLMGLLVWQLPRIHEYNLGVVTYVILVLAALVSALVLFSFLHSTAEVTGHHLGFSVRLGGAAAFFFIVLLTGLHSQTDSPPSRSADTTETVASRGTPQTINTDFSVNSKTGTHADSKNRLLSDLVPAAVFAPVRAALARGDGEEDFTFTVSSGSRVSNGQQITYKAFVRTAGVAYLLLFDGDQRVTCLFNADSSPGPVKLPTVRATPPFGKSLHVMVLSADPVALTAGNTYSWQEVLQTLKGTSFRSHEELIDVLP